MTKITATVKNTQIDMDFDAPNIVKFSSYHGRTVVGIRPPNKQAVAFALAMGDEALRLKKEHKLKWSDIEDLFYDACETFPISQLQNYVRLARDRDAYLVEFEALHSMGKSVTDILSHFRRVRSQAA